MTMSRRAAMALTLLAASMLAIGLPAPGFAAERAIEKEVVVPAALDKVWASWTTREGIVSFFAPDAVIDPRPGGAFHIHINPLAAPGEKGADDMRYLALQPMKMLSFDWNAPPHLPEARAQRTFVVLRFDALDATNTRVRLTHVGWGDGGEWDKTYAYFDKAWANVLAELKRRHEIGPRDTTSWMEQLRKYEASKQPGKS